MTFGKDMRMASGLSEQMVQIPINASISLEGNLNIPRRAAGMVLFAHGSGSSRHSPRNQAVAAELHQAGFGTLLIDLLTSHEERVDEVTLHLRFNIRLLAERLVRTIDWLKEQESTTRLPIGVFGASTGAAAALVAAVDRASDVEAVVSRGGRPDLAESILPKVLAPTLLIVGEYDESVIEMNETAADNLECEHEIAIVPGATHLFEEAGALEQVSRLASDWFGRHLHRVQRKEARSRSRRRPWGRAEGWTPH